MFNSISDRTLGEIVCSLAAIGIGFMASFLFYRIVAFLKFTKGIKRQWERFEWIYEYGYKYHTDAIELLHKRVNELEAAVFKNDKKAKK